MGFRRSLTGLLGSVLLCGITAAGQELRIAVLVNDSVGLAPAILSKAEQDAGRLFEDAGISIQWLHCGETDACRRALSAHEFVLHIVHSGRTQSSFVFGEAFLDEDQRGQYSDVFFDRVKTGSGSVDAGHLLGFVAAHELGHLLMGSHAHSQTGIMQPFWHSASVRKVGMGTLLFTSDQARLMRRRIQQQDRLPTCSFARTNAEFGLPSYARALRF